MNVTQPTFTFNSQMAAPYRDRDVIHAAVYEITILQSIMQLATDPQDLSLECDIPRLALVKQVYEHL